MAKATHKTDDISTSSLLHAPVPDSRNADLDLWLWVSVFPALTFDMSVKVKVKSLSHVWLFATLWTVAYQAPPSVGFSRQEYWSGLPFPSPGDLPHWGLNPGLPHCGQMLYRLSHQGSLDMSVVSFKPETSICWLLSFDFHRRIVIAFPTTIQPKRGVSQREGTAV